MEEREIKPYLIRSEFALQDVQSLVNDLGDLQADIERQLNLTCEANEIQIHLFRSRGGYQNYLRQRGHDGLNRQALFVQGDVGRVYAYRQFAIGANEKLERDVRHETTHALMHTALPYVPIWLDEGLAEYFEEPPGRREKHAKHGHELTNAVRYGWRPAIERLEAKRNLAEMNSENDYRDAWGIVHYLLHGPPAAREALSDYLKEIQSGKPPTPLSQHLRKRIPNLDQSIVNHLK